MGAPLHHEVATFEVIVSMHTEAGYLMYLLQLSSNLKLRKFHTPNDGGCDCFRDTRVSIIYHHLGIVRN